MEPLDYQREAVAEITARARAFFAGGWQDLPIKPRWASLIAGPTGTGKTTVAAMAAEALSTEATGRVSTLIVSAPNWMPLGAHNRGTKETVGVVAAHIARHDRTVLVLDELDKLISGAGGITGHGSGGSGDTWQSYIRAELYTVILDGRWPVGLSLPDIDDGTEISIQELERKLKSTVFVVGVGTFQNWYDNAGNRRTMGFCAEINPPPDELSADIVAQRMPRELANRFHGSIIRLPELREDDYCRIMREAESKLPLRMRKPFREQCQARMAGAIEAKKGLRFLEDAIMEVLKILPTTSESSETHIDTPVALTEINTDLCML